MKNVLVLTYWSYKDALVQTYTLPYVRLIAKNLPSGSRVHLVTLEQEKFVLTKEEKEQISAALEPEGITHMSLTYHPFSAKAAFAWVKYIFKLLFIISRKRITHIHTWCTPAGGIGYILSRLTGKPLIVDSYEPHAESMVENGTWQANSNAFKLLFKLEQLQSSRAIALIGLTESMKKYAQEKYNVAPSRFYVKPACIDTTSFKPLSQPKLVQLRKELGLMDKIVCVYAGKTGGIYLEREIFDLFKVAYDHWGERFQVVMLTDTSREALDALAATSGFPPALLVSKFVPHSEVVKYLSIGDFAINPVKPVPSKRYCTSIKDGEYWAIGLPVIIPAGISDDSDIIEQHNAGAVLHSFSTAAFKAAIIKVEELLQEDRERLQQRIRHLAHKYRSFEQAESIYRDIYHK